MKESLGHEVGRSYTPVEGSEGYLQSLGKRRIQDCYLSSALQDFLVWNASEAHEVAVEVGDVKETGKEPVPALRLSDVAWITDLALQVVQGFTLVLALQHVRSGDGSGKKNSVRAGPSSILLHNEIAVGSENDVVCAAFLISKQLSESQRFRGEAGIDVVLASLNCGGLASED